MTVPPPWQPLAVRAPESPTSDLRRAATTEVRLARNLAVLLGVDVPENPTGLTWVSDYNLLTVAEIGRGAPSIPKDVKGSVPPVGWYRWQRAILGGAAAARAAGDSARQELPGLEPMSEGSALVEIAPATLNKYGPETKAALVLAGADTLFSSVLPVMEGVLRLIGTSEDGRPLADAVRVTAWAVLIEDVYRAQPALFVAACKAREIQRAAVTMWSPMPSVDLPAGARTEFGSANARRLSTTQQPTTLEILDGAMHDVVAPRSHAALDAAEGEGGGPSTRFLNDDLISRWVRYLIASSDGGISWLEEDPEGRRTCEVFLTDMGALASYATDVATVLSVIEPVRATYDEQPVRARLDKADPWHRRRLVPRVVSVPELAGLPPEAQRAYVRTVCMTLRVLRLCDAFKSVELDELVRKAGRDLLVLSREVLGRDDLVTRMLEFSYLQWIQIDFRERPAEGSPEGEALAAGLSVIEMLDRAGRDFDDGRLPRAVWVSMLYGSSPVVNGVIQDLDAAGRVEEAATVREWVNRDWVRALEALGIHLDADPAQLQLAFVRLPSLLHNLLGLWLRQPDVDRRRQALRLGRDVLLPLRREVARQRQSEAPLRTSLQVLVRGACTSLPLLQEDEMPEVLELLVDLTQELVGTNYVTELLDQPQVSRGSQFWALNSIINAGLTLIDHGRPPRELSLDQLAEFLLECTAFVAGGTSARTREMQTLVERWEGLAGRRLLPPD